MALSNQPPRGVEFGESVNSARRGWGISLLGKGEAERIIRECKGILNSEKVQDEILPAAQLVRDVAKKFVHDGPGKTRKGKPRKHLRDLIFATKGRRYNSGMIAMASTEVADIFQLGAASEGPSVIMGVDLKKAPHAHLVEFGHAQVTGGKLHLSGKAKRRGASSGSVVGYVPAHPFIRPAVAVCRRMIVQIIQNALLKLLAPYKVD